MKATYVDASALMKLVAEESETTALRGWLELEPRDLVASDLVRTELMRATRRRDPAAAPAARAVLSAVALMPMTEATLDLAGFLEPPQLRTLDALHVAAALSLGDDLGAFVTYDRLQAAAAAQVGLKVIAPGT